MQENIEKILPEDFDGTFRFTNFSNKDFTAEWNGKEYNFPANSTSPMVFEDHSPVEIQEIRKRFAKKLAEREFFNSSGYDGLQNQERNNDGSPKLNSIHQAGTYSLDNLEQLIQRCLLPLEEKKASVTVKPKVSIEEKLTVNDEGEINTQSIDKKTSLRDKVMKGE